MQTVSAMAIKMSILGLKKKMQKKKKVNFGFTYFIFVDSNACSFCYNFLPAPRPFPSQVFALLILKALAFFCLPLEVDSDLSSTTCCTFFSLTPFSKSQYFTGQWLWTLASHSNLYGVFTDCLCVTLPQRLRWPGAQVWLGLKAPRCFSAQAGLRTTGKELSIL